jgi:glycosyl-4,4'-diaponeurosporenoate acyltransferase
MFRYYLAVIFGGPAALAAIGILFGNMSPVFAFFAAYVTMLIAFLIDTVVALIVRYLLPKRWMDGRLRFWRVHKSERAIYVHLGIRRWKDKIPETGGMLVGFSKKHIAEPKNPEYLLKFLSETCYAECMHFISVFAGFAVIPLSFSALLPFPEHLLYFGLPVAVINAILQILPILVQRYVRPFLLHAYAHHCSKENA